MIKPKSNGFQNMKIKLNSNAWMTLKSSVVIFQALKPLQPQWPQWPQQSLTEKVLKIQLEIFHDPTKKYFFLNIKIKLNSRTLITLKSPVVIFHAL